MSMKVVVGRICVLLVLVMSMAAPRVLYAQVSVTSSLFVFKSGARPVQNVGVSNSATVPMYVTVQVQQVKELGAQQVEYEPSEELLVSPKKFSIPPNGQRTVRMLLKNFPVDKERAYRVLVIPQQNDFDENQLQGRKSNKGSVMLKVATGVGMLVFAQPKEVVRKLRIERDSKGVKVVNDGNVQVSLSGGMVCPASVSLEEGDQAKVFYLKDTESLTAKGCTEFKGGRLHSGRSREIPAPAGARVYIGSRGDTSESYKLLEVPQEVQP